MRSGYLIISDCYVKAGGSSAFPGFESYAAHDETLRRLQAHGDVLLRELIAGDEQDEEGNQAIRKQAEALSHRHPELRPAFLRFAESQEQEERFIAENLVSALWIVRRT